MNLTREETIRVLELCSKPFDINICRNCPLHDIYDCISELSRNALHYLSESGLDSINEALHSVIAKLDEIMKDDSE